jgi:DNA-binding Lrp family transcriptional regulator
MTDAFVHVVVDPGAIHRAASRIGEIDQVGDVHFVTGDHDLIVQLDLRSRETLPAVVAEEIHGVTGVIDTVTNVAYRP